MGRRSCRRVWGGAPVKDGPPPEAGAGPENFEVTDRKSERRAVLIEYSRSRRIGGSPSVGRNRANRLRRAVGLHAYQTPARAVTTSGQLSLGSLWSADEERAFKLLARLWGAGAGLHSARADAQRAHEGGWNDPHLVAELEGSIRNAKRFRARLEDDSGWGPLLQVAAEPSRPVSHLFENLAIRPSNTDLRFRAAEIDSNMVHGWSLSLRL